MTLPDNMQKEFIEIFNANREAMGTLPARGYALGVMLGQRRSALVHALTMLSLDNDPESPPMSRNEVTQLTAELTLLMIERGA